LAVVALLGVHVGLASLSLVRENPTIDEVAHLPAGITYWQKGTFRLYAQNPPLVKLIAALPVVLSRPAMDRIYTLPSWRQNVHASVAHEFAVDNAERYFELFTLARLVIPWFSVVGGLVIFAWSRRLYGDWGGLLSLTLWCFCPNVLAHARLVTTDVGATALGVLATWLFWRYVRSPSWRRAGLAGIGLGLAVLAKFSNLLLFGIWPLIWAVAELASLPAGSSFRGGESPGEPRRSRQLGRRLTLSVGQGVALVGVALLVINAGYGFEGSFRPLGRFEFASDALTRDLPRPRAAPRLNHQLQALALPFRENRFRGTPLQWLPTPLPAPFLEGFDLQKLDAEGIPERFVDPNAPEDAVSGYPVYLDGELRSSGWWYYYLAALAYKVPEGTWALGLLSLVVLVGSRRARATWADEFAVAIVPVTVLLAMSFGTDINLGLRYILPAFPYAFIAIGKVAPWAIGLARRARVVAIAVVAVCLAGTVTAAALVHPHYLAYFNWASGGPDRGSEHLIDSNLDWGQDLVTLRDWLRANAPGERVGLAYFGQINPNILKLRNEGFDWFLPPPLPGTIRPGNPAWVAMMDGPPPRLEPGLYAVSASFVRGLPYALYDSSLRVPNLYPGWDSRGTRSDRPAFGYFAGLKPEARVGHSLFVYRVTPEQAAELAPLWNPR
jgi:hypothetical protein